jgi:zinc transporter, ZIP family
VNWDGIVVWDFLSMLALATVMGLSIFLSMPIVLRRSRTLRLVTLLNAAAIGILLFVLADVWGNVAVILYPAGSFLSNPGLDAVFVAGVGGAFAVLYALEHSSRASREHREMAPTTTALIVALAIGFQNLTEGMVFGSAWSAGAIGLLFVVFVGFFLQNVTEGFPISGPLLGARERRVGLFAGYFFVGGLPTILGAGIGYFWTSTPLIVAFDALAIGTCLYVILPMMRGAFRAADTPEATFLKQRLTYVGIGVGFLIGFLVNAF